MKGTSQARGPRMPGGGFRLRHDAVGRGRNAMDGEVGFETAVQPDAELSPPHARQAHSHVWDRFPPKRTKDAELGEHRLRNHR